MSSIARSAVITFDAALAVEGMNPPARLLCADRDWHGQALADCLTSFAQLAPAAGAGRATPGITAPAVTSASTSATLRLHLRAGTAFTLLIGSRVWRAEITSLSGPIDGTGPAEHRPSAGPGVLILREAGEASDYRDLSLERIEFRTALSHDLRTPLNAMAGWIHLLSSTLADPPELAVRALAGLRRAVGRQRELIETRIDRKTGPDTRPANRPAGGLEAASPPDGSSCPNLAGCHILAVDDDPDLLDMLSELLAAEGAVVVTADSADSALAHYLDWARKGGERIVISDLAMPGRDGMSLIREIRQIERCHHLPHLPAVALSAHGIPDIRRRALDNGFDLFLDKPIDPPALVKRLCQLVDR